MNPHNTTQTRVCLIISAPPKAIQNLKGWRRTITPGASKGNSGPFTTRTEFVFTICKTRAQETADKGRKHLAIPLTTTSSSSGSLHNTHTETRGIEHHNL